MRVNVLDVECVCVDCEHLLFLSFRLDDKPVPLSFDLNAYQNCDDMKFVVRNE